jgi:hypothetical protein
LDFEEVAREIEVVGVKEVEAEYHTGHYHNNVFPHVFANWPLTFRKTS